MKILKRILQVLLIALFTAQFIRPTKNISTGQQSEMTNTIQTTSEVQSILQESCYDCHSNTTRYPWYAEIQPVGWWLNSHIQDGKRELNFSEFGAYRPRRQFRKLEEVIDMVNEGAMPLPSYLWVHTDARLPQEQKKKLIGWANAIRDSISAKYPADSLVSRRR